MNRCARSKSPWIGRRLALLGSGAAVAAVAVGLQAVRLGLEPNGAAVHGVALLVDFIVLSILFRLLQLELAGPGVNAPADERQAHRATLREAPLVAVVGMGVASFLTLVTPRLVAEERPAASTEIAVRLDETDRFTASTIPDSPVAAMAPSFARVPAVVRLLDPPADGGAPRPIEINYRWLEGGQEELSQDPMQEPVDPTRPGRDSILRATPAPEALPPVRFGAGTILATVRGSLELGSDGGAFDLDVNRMRGEQRFELGLDVTAELPLTPESSLKILYAGAAISERGHLSEAATFGSASAAAGERYDFEMRWSHLYMGLAKRLIGYTPDSWFDLSVHAGAMVDHTLAEFETASGVEAASEDGERGWVSPGVGLSLAFRGPGRTGFAVEVVQSVPVNIGGQAIALTDLRAGMTMGIIDGVSLYLGYRYVESVYRLFDAPLVREGGRTAAEVSMSGPVLGLDFRF